MCGSVGLLTRMERKAKKNSQSSEGNRRKA